MIFLRHLLNSSQGHFQYAKYLNELVTRFFEKGHSRGDEDDAMRFDVLCKDRPCQQYILLAIEHYALTLKLDMKHVYQALPRLLSLWFDFVSLEPPELDPDGSLGSIKREYIRKLIVIVSYVSNLVHNLPIPTSIANYTF